MRFGSTIFAGVILGFVLSLGASCNRQRAVVDYAADMLEAGEFERALELVNRVDSIHNTPELDGLRGTILSLEPATMVDGMFLMNRSVDGLDDARLRRDLFQLYLDTGLGGNAAQLVSGDRVGPERFFRRDIVRMRAVVRCLENPDPAAAKKLLEDLPAGEEKSDEYYAPVRDASRLYALLCLGKGIRAALPEPDLYWLYDDVKREAKIGASPALGRPHLRGLTDAFVLLISVSPDDAVASRNRCEMIARSGPTDAARGASLEAAPPALKEELLRCKKRFPGSLVMRRVWPADLVGLDAERGGPMLFDESPFYPVYVPRPEFEPSAEDSLPDPGHPVGGQ